MIRAILSPKPQTDLRNAKEYFREHLAVGDYYSQGQVIAGEWLGKGSQSLESVKVVPKRYHALQDPDGAAVLSITVEPSGHGDGE